MCRVLIMSKRCALPGLFHLTLKTAQEKSSAILSILQVRRLRHTAGNCLRPRNLAMGDSADTHSGLLNPKATHWSVITVFLRPFPLLVGIKDVPGNPEDKRHLSRGCDLEVPGVKAKCLATGEVIHLLVFLGLKAKTRKITTANLSTVLPPCLALC